MFNQVAPPPTLPPAPTRRHTPAPACATIRRPRPRFPLALIPLAAFLLFAAIALHAIATNPYPGPLDELEHVSYAAHLQETGNWRLNVWHPDFESMRTLPRNSLATWDDRPNYLGHPAPFYWVISLVLDRTLPLPAAILHVRLASAAFILAGLALTLAAGWRSFARHPAALATFSALTALCPKLIPVTDQVTNDALALAAGGLAYWSATRRPTTPTLAAAAVALTLACWSKPNAGLAIGAVLLLTALLDPRRRPARLTALAAGALLGAIPYLPILAKYGRLVPITAEQFGQVHQLPGPAYLPAFLANLAYTFCQQQTGTWPLPDTPSALATALVWLFLLTILAAAWHIARTRPTATARAPAIAPAIAGPLAFLLILPIHLIFAAIPLGGSIPAASFRYELPLWPFLAHTLATRLTTAPPHLRNTLTYLSFLTLLIGWLSP